MIGRESFRHFLATDPQDAGCAGTFALIDAYVERALAHGDASVRYPEVAAHLRVCQPCAEDFRGLLVIAGSQNQ